MDKEVFEVDFNQVMSDEGKCLYEQLLWKAYLVAHKTEEFFVFYLSLDRLPMKNGKSRFVIKLPMELRGIYSWKSLPQITADIFLSIIYPDVFIL